MHNENQLKEEYKQVFYRNRKIALLWLIMPSAGLLFILVAYSIAGYIINTISESNPVNVEYYKTVMAVINVILGFIGIFVVMGIIMGIPIAIHYFRKKELTEGSFDPRSGKGYLSDFPQELKGWSWGAFMFGWIWGVFNNVWLSFLVFIPIFHWFWVIVLGIKGKEWAWEQRQWESVEEFKRVQKKWNWWGLGFFLFNILIIFWIVIAGSIGSSYYN